MSFFGRGLQSHSTVSRSSSISDGSLEYSHGVLGLRPSVQTRLALKDGESKHRLEGVDSIIAAIVQVAVGDVQIVQDDPKLLGIVVLASVLLHALVVYDLEEARQIIDIHVDVVEESDVPVDAVADDDDLARLSRGPRGGQYLSADFLDLVDADHLGVSMAVSARSRCMNVKKA